MYYEKSKLALAVIAASGLAACGGSGGGGGGGGGGGQDPISSITSDVEDLDDRGDWGSIVLSGYGKVNDANAENQLQTEAVPDDVTRWFGGVDNNDSSGTIEYAIVAETGEAFRQDEEVQGITVEGSGSGTRIANVQVINSDDDGIEWFGGAANARNVVIQAATDDPLDQDLGWQGTGKKALVIHGPDSGNRGMETDNNGDDFAASPKTEPVWTNVTILGNTGNSGDTSEGALHREGYGGEIYRTVYSDNELAGTEFQDGCLDVDDEVDDNLEYNDVVFNCAAGTNGLADDTDEGANNANYQTDFSNTNRYDVKVDTDLGIDAETWAINTDESFDSGSKGAFTTRADDGGDNEVTADDYFGAVDPAADAPNDNPSDGGPFWDGWTYRSADLNTNLPSMTQPGGPDGNAENFHPLRAEIGGASGDITPASSNECADKGNGLGEADDVQAFGQTWPVCVIEGDELDGDFTLTNDHIYVLDGTVQVGNGDEEGMAQADDGSLPSDLETFTLEIEPGTQIYGATDTDPSLVITRGSEIDAVGTPERPIVFGAVTVER